MSVNEDEDFELILGNRQILILAIVLFAVFFSIGYTVGYSRGSESADNVAAATRGPAATSQAAPSLPATEPEVPGNPIAKTEPVRSSPEAFSPRSLPSESVTARASTPEPSTHAEAATPQPTSPSASERATSSQRIADTATVVTQQASLEPRAPTAAESTPPLPSEGAQESPKTTIAVPAIEPGAIYLQVLASRDADPARESLIELRGKGHSVTLDNSDPGWYRILVGPFHEQKEAAQYQLRLKAEGIDSFVRML